MKKEIEFWLMGTIFPVIGMDAPDNLLEIIKFIEEDVIEVADPIAYHDGDFGIAFRRFLESKTNTN